MFRVGLSDLMTQIKGSGCEHMKFLTFGTSLHKMKHPNMMPLTPFSIRRTVVINPIETDPKNIDTFIKKIHDVYAILLTKFQVPSFVMIA